MSTPNGGRVTAATALARLETHEAVCAERYAEINEALRSIKAFLARATFSLIGGLFFILGVILFELAKNKSIL
ncbi:MAG: hypothetical protein KGI92_11555 [Alphaproteobacteria bacterium]|nr:hypothetical protein [Alphaproteobacteria bacterium]